MSLRNRSLFVLFATLASGCPDNAAPLDAPMAPDVPAFDGGVPEDEGVGDTGVPDAGAPDAGSPDVGTRDAGSRDAMPGDAPTMPDAPFTADRIVYFVDAFDLPSMPAGMFSDIAPGANLDGVVSDGSGTASCIDVIPDLRSPRGTLGVDNEFIRALTPISEGFIEATLQSQLDGRIADGSFVLAVELTGLESLVDDADVTVDLYLVKAEDCVAESCPLPAGVAAGATWIARGAAIATSSRASIVDGHLSAFIDPLPFPVAVFGASAELSMLRGVLEGELSTTALTEGAMAGAVTIDDLVEAAAGTRVEGEPTRSLCTALADLSPSASDALVCTELSAGVGIRGVVGTLIVE